MSRKMLKKFLNGKQDTLLQNIGILILWIRQMLIVNSRRNRKYIGNYSCAQTGLVREWVWWPCSTIGYAQCATSLGMGRLWASLSWRQRSISCASAKFTMTFVGRLRIELCLSSLKLWLWRSFATSSTISTSARCGDSIWRSGCRSRWTGAWSWESGRCGRSGRFRWWPWTKSRLCGENWMDGGWMCLSGDVRWSFCGSRTGFSDFLDCKFMGCCLEWSY